MDDGRVDANDQVERVDCSGGVRERSELRSKVDDGFEADIGDELSRRWTFHDTKLSSIVDAAYQALAIDEQRRPFKPAVWEPQTDSENQIVQQVWFSGVHSDVGGGYGDTGLSDIALTWMVHRALINGLEFKPRTIIPAPGSIILSSERSARVDPESKGILHKSRTTFYRLMRPFVRGIGQQDAAHEYAGSTAVERRDAKECNYAPNGLVGYLGTPGRQIIDVLAPVPVDDAQEAA